MLKPGTTFAEPEIDENRRSFLFPNLSEASIRNQLIIPGQENKSIQIVTDEEAMFWDGLEGDQKERAARLLEMDVPLERIMKMVHEAVFETAFSRREVLNGAKNAVVNKVLSSLLPKKTIKGIIREKKEILMPGVEKIRNPQLRELANQILKNFSRAKIQTKYPFFPEKNEEKTNSVNIVSGAIIAVPTPNTIEFIHLDRTELVPEYFMGPPSFEGAKYHHFQIDFTVHIGDEGVFNCLEIAAQFRDAAGLRHVHNLAFTPCLKRKKSGDYELLDDLDGSPKGIVKFKNFKKILALLPKVYAYIQKSEVLKSVIYGHCSGEDEKFFSPLYQNILNILSGKEDRVPLSSFPEIKKYPFESFDSFRQQMVKLDWDFQEARERVMFGKHGMG